jgi:hypothetical protein
VIRDPRTGPVGWARLKAMLQRCCDRRVNDVLKGLAGKRASDQPEDQWCGVYGGGAVSPADDAQPMQVETGG